MTKHICLIALSLFMVFSPTPLMAYQGESFCVIDALGGNGTLIKECGLLQGNAGKTAFVIESATSAETSYYFDGTDGDDSRDGLSPETAWKSILITDTLQLKAGDRILLKKGTQFTNQYISLNNQTGTAASPIIIDAYGEGSNPIINPSPLKKHGIVITACEYLEVQNLEITGGSGGVFFTWLDEIKEFRHFTFRNLHIHDCYLGNGSAFLLNMIPNGGVRKSEYTDILIENCNISMIARSAVLAECLNNVDIRNNRIQDTGGPGIVLHKSFTGIIQGNYIQSTGSKKHPSFNGRGSCAWLLGCRDMLVEKNIFENANGWLDSFGFHLDIGNTNCVVQYNLSRDNAGGFVQVLGKNKNCAYRYNISVNDGWRVKGIYDHPEEKNIENGCIISLSGYVVNETFEGPYDTYIYNNTVYVKEDIDACFNFRYTMDGALIANNIFHFTGNSKNITTTRKEREPLDVFPKDVVYNHNLYLKSENHPTGMLIADNEIIIGDALFANPGGYELRDYYPGNNELIKDQGIEISKIPNDPTGIKIGLRPDKDILGNPVIGKPDFGAIEISETNHTNQKKTTDIEVFPTLTNSLIHIKTETERNMDIWISDPSGKSVLHESLTGDCSIDLNSLPAGLYILAISYNYNREHFKIIKK